MEFVRKLWCSNGNSERCNNLTFDENIPNVQKWFREMDAHSLVLVTIASLMTGVVLCLGALHLYFVLRFISNEQIRTDLYWLVFMAPVVAVCGLFGMVLPRTALFLYAVALVYFMICIFVIVCLMCSLNGNRETMCEKLLAKGVEISLQTCPLGCCLCCFKKFKPTETNFLRCEWLVFQATIVRVLLEILNITMFMELNNRSHLYFQLSNLIGMISLLIGSYGSYLIIPAGSSLLLEYRFLRLFRVVDISQLLWSVQKIVVDFLAMIFILQNSRDILPISARMQFYISFLLCVEMFVASLLSTWWFRPSRCALFDAVDRPSGSESSLKDRHQSYNGLEDGTD